MNMTSKQKQTGLLALAIGLGFAMLAVYLLSFRLPLLMTIGYALDPISIISYVISVPGALFILAIIITLTFRNVERSKDRQRWLDSHASNEQVVVTEEGYAASKTAQEYSITNDQYIALLRNDEVTVVPPKGNTVPIVGDVVRVRHEEDFGQMKTATVVKVSASEVTFKKQ